MKEFKNPEQNDEPNISSIFYGVREKMRVEIRRKNNQIEMKSRMDAFVQKSKIDVIEFVLIEPFKKHPDIDDVQMENALKILKEHMTDKSFNKMLTKVQFEMTLARIIKQISNKDHKMVLVEAMTEMANFNSQSAIRLFESKIQEWIIEQLLGIYNKIQNVQYSTAIIVLTKYLVHRKTPQKIIDYFIEQGYFKMVNCIYDKHKDSAKDRNLESEKELINSLIGTMASFLKHGQIPNQSIIEWVTDLLNKIQDSGQSLIVSVNVTRFVRQLMKKRTPAELKQLGKYCLIQRLFQVVIQNPVVDNLTQHYNEQSQIQLKSYNQNFIKMLITGYENAYFDKFEINERFLLHHLQSKDKRTNSYTLDLLILILENLNSANDYSKFFVESICEMVVTGIKLFNHNLQKHLTIALILSSGSIWKQTTQQLLELRLIPVLQCALTKLTEAEPEETILVLEILIGYQRQYEPKTDLNKMIEKAGIIRTVTRTTQNWKNPKVSELAFNLLDHYEEIWPYLKYQER